MRDIAKFYTRFWCIYFPTCIAFNEMAFFSVVDEIMTGVLILYTYKQKGKRCTNKEPWKEYNIFWGLLVFYIVYSLIMRVNVVDAIWYDLMQQIRPWSVIFCTWILNPQFSEKQKKWMRNSMVLTVLVFLVYHPETAANAYENSENRSAPFGQLAICTSMTWYLFSKQTKKNMFIATAIAIVGLLGMKFKYYGEFGAWMFMLWYIKGKLSWKNSGTFMKLGFLLFIVVMLGWDRLNTYYIEGADNTELARPMINKATWKILWDYFPFGAGLGTFATAASAVYYSPLWAKYELSGMWGLNFGGMVGFHCDSFFGTFAQIGYFGLFFFVIFWKRRLVQFTQIDDMRYYRVAMMTFFCTFIEWFGDSAFLSGKGMGYLMLMGLCLNMRPSTINNISLEYNNEINDRKNVK